MTYEASVVTGAADVQDIALNSATTGNITVNGVETANVTLTGSNTVADLITGAEKVNFLGAGSATIGDVLDGATTIDGSAATGALSFGIDATKDVKAVGGSGDDTITVSGLTSADDIDAGAGTDFVAFANADVPTTKVTNLKSFEGVQLNAVGTATVGVNVDNFSGSTINQFKIGTGADNANGVTSGAVNITNGTTGSTVTQFDDTGTNGAVTFALKTDGAADVLNYNLVNVDTAGTADTHGLSSLTATGIETLNLNASNKVKVGTTYDADTLAIATLNASAATKLIITGTSAVALGTTASTLTALTTVDASAMTKNVTLGAVGTAFSTANTGATVTTGTGTDFVSLSVGSTGVLKAVDLGSQSSTSTGDTLALSGGGALTGVSVIDLTSTTDQVQQLLGSANLAAQVGIENIDLSDLNGSAQVTGTATANTIVGTATADTINGGGGNDAITGGLGADSMAGGAGADTFSFGTNGSIAGTSLDKITDFNTGGADILDFGATAVLLAADATAPAAGTNASQTAGGKLAFHATDATLAQKITTVQADAQLDAAQSVAFFEDGGNSYVYYAGAATGNADDQIVELTGVTGLTTIAVNGAGDITIA
ncbi:MAG: calcium-binding protein [Marinobacter alexandrii]|uniref:beta strand repeat-containing protein n=1 Tax=Marinobacter alexandrii TaxID=2570351 RepID=UPI0032973AAB